MRKLINFIAGIISIPFALFFVIFVRLISLFVIIRWCALISTRIGHFAENTNIYLSEKKIRPPKIDKRPVIDIFYFYPEVCNYQLAKMFKKQIFILPYFFMNKVNFINERILNRIFRTCLHDIGYYRSLNDFIKNKKIKISNLADGINRNLVFPPLSPNDGLNSQESAEINISFTPKEIKRGKKILREFGVDIEKQNIVGIILRDNDYLKKMYPNIDWDYHKIRESSYEYYENCVDELAKLGYTVFVMGVNDKKICERKNIINYNTSGLKSDFMDIFLSSQLKFAVSSGNGLDAIPIIFKKPIIEVAIAPLLSIRPYSKNIKILFKTYYSRTLNRKLSLKEIFDLRLQSLQGNTLSDEIEFIHPTAEEITSAAIEMHKEINENYDYSKNEYDLEEKFKDLYLKLVDQHSKNRSVKVFSSTISKLFLKNNKNLLN